jgi:Pyruvate/2-oxoacid:ferredoxin oxidoreductase gamma subunit
LCETLRANHAPFLARRAYYDRDLSEVIEKAIAFEGFSFVEVMEFCTAYYVPFNKFDKKRMEEILSSENLPRMTFVDESRTEYTVGYDRYCKQFETKKTETGAALEKNYEHGLSGSLDIVIAGSAGMKVTSTATLLARAAILSGLHAVQRGDYPVTVKTGPSISFVKLSEKKSGYMGMKTPDVLFLLSKEGLKKADSLLQSMQKGQRVYILSTLPEVRTPAKVTRLDLGKLSGRIPKEGIVLAVLSSYLKSSGLFPADALMESIKLNPDSRIVQKQVQFAEAGQPILFEINRKGAKEQPRMNANKTKEKGDKEIQRG